MSNVMSKEQLVAAVKGILVLQNFDLAERVRDDLELTRQMTADEEKSFLSNRYYMTRVFAGLNEVAEAFGSVTAFTLPIIEFLKARDYSYAEIEAICARIDKGFAREAYKPKSDIAGTPGEEDLRQRISEQGVVPTPLNERQSYAELAGGRAKIQARHADAYKAAMEQGKEAAEALLLPRLPLTYDPTDPARPPRTYEWADRIERGEFFPMLVDGNIVVARDFPSALAVAPDNRIDNDRMSCDAGAAKSSVAPVAADATALPFAGAAASEAFVQDLPEAEGPEPNTQRGGGTPQSIFVGDSQPAGLVSPGKEPGVFLSDAVENAVDGLAKVDTIPDLCEAMLIRFKILNPKRQRQYRSSAELLQTVAGTDRSAAIKEADIETFRDLLDLLPPTFGRSPADKKKSLAQLVEEGRALPPEKRGLKPGTINRRMGEVRALIKFAKKKHFRWVTSDFEIDHVRDPEAAKNKRGRFSADQLQQLFSHKTWTDPARAVWPSVYFVPIISVYALARREEIVGLKRRDIYVSSREIHIRYYSDHSVKNEESVRIIPIPEEAIRLGFLDYIASLPDDPFGDVFPEIRQAAPKTKRGDTFYKRWAPILEEAIPDAKEAKVVFHSFRHTGIDIFVNTPGVPAEIRRGLSGHAQKGVDVEVYLKRIAPERMRRMMKKFPLFTSHLQPRDWKTRRS